MSPGGRSADGIRAFPPSTCQGFHHAAMRWGPAGNCPFSRPGTYRRLFHHGRKCRNLGHGGEDQEGTRSGRKSSGNTSLCFSPDGAMLAAGPSRGYVRIYAPATGDYMCALPWFEGTSSLAFSSSGTLLAVGGRDGSIKLWEVTSRRVVQVIMAHDYFVSALAFSPDGTLLASSSWDRKVKLWKVPSGILLMPLRQGGGAVPLIPSFPGAPGKDEPVGRKEQPLTAVAFSPDGACCASCAQDGVIFLWNVASGELKNKIEGAYSSISSLAYSPPGDLLACGLDDGSLVLAAPSTRDRAAKIPAHRGEVQFVSFADQGHRLLTGSLDGTVITWSLSPGEAPSSSP